VADFIKQSIYSSDSARTRQRTAFLEDVRSTIEMGIAEYLEKHPNGEQITLHVLDTLGEAWARHLATDRQWTLEEIKQAIGLYVPIVLCDMFGPDKVETLRQEDSKANSTRKVTKDFPKLTGWVTAYTPHRVVP